MTPSPSAQARTPVQPRQAAQLRQPVQPRALRTRARLLDVALDLFERQGYDRTTTQQIAEAAGVSQMTFFRHFPTKESVLVTDPYYPLIADAVAAQPHDLLVIERVRRGFLAALTEIDAQESDYARRRIALLDTPTLRGTILTGSQATEDAVVSTLAATGTDPRTARIAVVATIAAIGAGLIAWSTDETEASLGDVVSEALAVLAGAEGKSRDCAGVGSAQKGARAGESNPVDHEGGAP